MLYSIDSFLNTCSLVKQVLHHKENKYFHTTVQNINLFTEKILSYIYFNHNPLYLH